jgi:hypothetical protein
MNRFSRATTRYQTVCRRPGYTLAEMMICLPLLTLFISGAFSCLAIMRQTIDFQNGPGKARFQGALNVMRIGDDLRDALSFSIRNANDVEFTVPDRNGDAMDDKVRYSWSGTAGAPLLYKFNSLATETIALDVNAFALSYQFGIDTAAPLEEELAILKYHDDFPGAKNEDFKLESDKWIAQYIFPNLPPGGTFWTIKRLRFMAKREGGDIAGIIRVQITTADGSLKPTTTIVDQQTIPESSLDVDFGWVNVDFTSANQLDPTKGYCIVIASAAPSGSAGKIMFQKGEGGLPLTAGTHWMTSDDSGVSWSTPEVDRDLRFFAFGTYDNYVPTSSLPLTSVGISLQMTSDAGARIDSSIRILNAPMVVQ